MPRRQPPPEPRVVLKDFTPDEIDRGIEKLKRRIQELAALDPSTTSHNDASVENLTHKIRETIRDVFGEKSAEFNRYEHLHISHGDTSGVSVFSSQQAAERNRQDKFVNGIPHTIKILEGLIGWLREKKEDLTQSCNKNTKLLIHGMDLHPRISEVCRDLYQNEHYANAVFDASKALVNYVKEKASKHDLDGAPLMRTVFSKNDPVLAFNDLQDQSDHDEQEGMMHLFEGAVLALRNPRGHSFRYDTPERALEYIGLLSMLAKRLAEAKRRK